MFEDFMIFDTVLNPPAGAAQGVSDPELDDNLVTSNIDPNAVTPDASDELAGGDEAGGSAAPGGKPKVSDEPKLFTQEDVDKIVVKRAERMARQMAEKPERKAELVESLAEQADVPPLGHDEAVKAVRLWSYLKHNPTISQKIDQLLAAERGAMPQRSPLHQRSRVDAGPDPEARIELIEVKVELRGTDPVFKKYERSIIDWAEGEGIEIKDARSLKLAYRAWKGEKSALLAANAELKGRTKAASDKANVAAAAGVPRQGGPKPPKQDYTKLSDEEVLAAHGLKLFDDPE